MATNNRAIILKKYAGRTKEKVRKFLPGVESCKQTKYGQIFKIKFLKISSAALVEMPKNKHNKKKVSL